MIDLFTRRIIGWDLSRKIDEELTLTALEIAIKNRDASVKVIHHADCGV